MIKLIILDRDGVINKDSPEYIKSPQEWQAIPGSLEAIVKLNQAGLRVCITTNQSGVGRGYFSLNMLEQIHKKLLTQLAKQGGTIDAIFFCPHLPQDNCICRKPKPGLYQKALNYFSVKAEESIVVGDTLRDVEPARDLGSSSVLVETGHPFDRKKQNEWNIPVYRNLSEFVNLFLKTNA